MSFSGLFIFFIKILTFSEEGVIIAFKISNKNTIITKVKIKESLFMKKLKAMILAVFLGALCVGNPLNAVEPNSQESVSSDFAKNFNLPVDDTSVGEALHMFGNIFMSRLADDTKELTQCIKIFSDYISNMSKDGKKYLGALVIFLPINRLFDDMSVSAVEKATLTGNILSGIYHNIDSVECEIDATNHSGKLNLNMKDIPDYVTIPLWEACKKEAYRSLINIQRDKIKGNKISCSF